MLLAVRNDPVYQGRAKTLWDFRQVVEFPSASEIRVFATLAKRKPASARTTAFVVDQSVHFGLTRMFEMLVEQPGIERRVFGDYDQAWEWLLRTEPPAGPD